MPWGATHLLRGSHSAPDGTAAVVVQPPHTIAVLPLVDVTPGDGNTYLGDGLAQELSSRLARIHGLRVASRTSAFAFKDRETDVRTIAQTLGVRHVLEGSVMRQGNQLRVTAQLVDAASGYNVWSQTYNRTWQDLVAIQDEIARSIVGTLQVVRGERSPSPRRPPHPRGGVRSVPGRTSPKLQGPGRAKQLPRQPRTASARRSPWIRSSPSPMPGCASVTSSTTRAAATARWSPRPRPTAAPP